MGSEQFTFLIVAVVMGFSFILAEGIRTRRGYLGDESSYFVSVLIYFLLISVLSVIAFFSLWALGQLIFNR